SITIHSYPVYHNALIDGISYLAGYNSKTHNIDVFELNSKSFNRHINLEHHGPHGIEDVRGLYIHNWDSIFISSTINIYLINSNGQIIKSFNLLNEDLFKGLEEGSLTSTSSFGIHYSVTRNSFILNFMPNNVEFGTKEYYSKPFIAEYFLDNYSLRLIPIPYSKYFIDNHVGFLSVPAISIYSNKIYVCFQGESNIYSYDMENEKISVYGAQSRYSKNVAKPIDLNASFDKKLRHRLESPMFFNLIYDPLREFFYRLHFGDMDSMGSNIRGPFHDKSLYLMVFNKDLELIDEIKLEDHRYIPSFYGISYEGLFLNANHDLSNNLSGDFANFKLIKINITE
ncbi:MAG: DUF4221 family protein, partial [Bacteroidales bacterium]